MLMTCPSRSRWPGWRWENFATFIDSTNDRASIAQRGHAKQKRNDLWLVGLCTRYAALFTSGGDDAGDGPTRAGPTVVFDAGQRSAANFAHLSGTGLHFVGSLAATLARGETRWHHARCPGGHQRDHPPPLGSPSADHRAHRTTPASLRLRPRRRAPGYSPSTATHPPAEHHLGNTAPTRKPLQYKANTSQDHASQEVPLGIAHRT